MGQVSLAHDVLDEAVARHLPEGVSCISIRYRANDQLCLVILSDRRARWDAASDHGRARDLVSDLKALGVARPRIQWVRTTPEKELKELKLRRATVTYRPLFWAFCCAQLMNWVFMPWPDAMLATTFGFVVWKLAHWLLREDGFEQVKVYVPTKVRRLLK